jgi:uncharacterized protein YukE
MTLISRTLGIAALLAASFTFALLTVSPAFAETSASTEASATVNAEIKPRPLQLINQKRLELKADTRAIIDGFKDDRIELRGDVKADMRNASTSGERKDIRTDAREDRADLRGELRADLSANIKERVQLALRAHLGAIVKRMNAATERFDNLSARIDSRIEKLKADGVATASVEASLDATNVLIVTAKADVKALETLITSVNESTDKEAFKAEIRAATTKATTSIKAAHAGLLRTAEQLKALVKVSAEAETSVETNN